MAMTPPPNGGAGLTGKGGRKTASVCDLAFVIVIVEVGARTATAQNSAIAIVPGLILSLILVFIFILCGLHRSTAGIPARRNAEIFRMMKTDLEEICVRQDFAVSRRGHLRSAAPELTRQEADSTW